jgi:hypothetical protein
MKTAAFKISRISFLTAIGGFLLLAANHLRAGDALQSGANDDSTPVQYVYVAGEVRIPQRCVYTNGMTLGTAIKMAGGVTDKASQTQVTLTRGTKKPLMLDRRSIEDGKGKDIKLKPDDKVFVARK